MPGPGSDLPLTRRSLIGALLTAPALGSLSACATPSTSPGGNDGGAEGEGHSSRSRPEAPTRADRLRMPDEGSAHSRTWMAFGASAEISRV